MTIPRKKKEEKRSTVKAGVEPRCAAVQADALTTGPRRRSDSGSEVKGSRHGSGMAYVCSLWFVDCLTSLQQARASSASEVGEQLHVLLL